MRLEEALQAIGDKIIRGAKANLIRKRKRASGTLYDSLKAKVEDNQLTFDMASYGQYVDQGRRPGKFAPVVAIKEWCKIKGIHTNFAYVINKKIKEKGIRPTFFFTKAYEDNIDDLDKVLDGYLDTLVEGYMDIDL